MTPRHGEIWLVDMGMHQAMAGSESEVELPAAAALREDAKKHQ